MTPGRILWLIRRDLQRGLNATWHARVTAPRIVRPTAASLPPAPWPVEVHVLLGHETWLLALWMLASWEHHTGYRWPVRLWEDGTFTPAIRHTIATARPKDTLTDNSAAAATVAPLLARYPACTAYRSQHPLAQKIFDIPLLATTPRFLLLDSDVLFFSRPAEVLAWCDAADDAVWFNEDVNEGSLVTPTEAATLGLNLWPRVNSGLCLLQGNVLDLDLCERALRETSLLSGHPWRVEQTLFAVCASRHGRGGLLPPTYEVSLNRHRRPGAVARHYVGAVRDRFYAEGVATLHSALLS